MRGSDILNAGLCAALTLALSPRKVRRGDLFGLDLCRAAPLNLPMLVLIDNYDSFTYNLVHFLGELGAPCEVFRNDKISVAASSN